MIEPYSFPQGIVPNNLLDIAALKIDLPWRLDDEGTLRCRTCNSPVECHPHTNWIMRCSNRDCAGFPVMSAYDPGDGGKRARYGLYFLSYYNTQEETQGPPVWPTPDNLSPKPA